MSNEYVAAVQAAGHGPAPEVEAAGQAIIHAGMRREQSPYWTECTWTEENATELIRRIYENADMGAGSFREKLRKQLDGAPKAVFVLAAELISIHLLPISTTLGATKRSRIEEVLQWADTDYTIPEVIERAFSAPGSFGSGTGYNTSQWEHVVWLAKFVQLVSSLSQSQRDEALTAPEAFARLTDAVEHRVQGIRFALEYLAWPSYFPPVVSRDHRRRIRAAFSAQIGGVSGDSELAISQDLAAIRLHQEQEFGRGQVEWYDSPFREQWDAEKQTSKLEEIEVAAERSHPTESQRTAGSDGLLFDVSDELADSLFVDREGLQEVIELLRTRKQIVLYGPPGTGKTFLARALARHQTGESSQDLVTTVQFHPSYAYEDFFEGYRPTSDGKGNVGFRLDPGPLRRIAAAAAKPENRDRPFFLIIDEMNRGNLAKVFGELYYLLEYRDEAIALQYSPTESFSLPPNLFLIGTMNTADRSIAMVDAAIRRRFAFVELHPQEGLIANMLSRYLTANGMSQLRAQLLDTLNKEIDPSGRDLMIGPSYFMKRDADSEDGLSRIWKYELLPLLEEHYYGRLERAQVHAQFGLEGIRRRATISAQARDSEGDDDSVES
ncbi:McrB family protein [Sinomonas humi]|uniref:McrB family protein n=1 Tax=Sinomonas humi TaxID=1338436 RepID=UPI00068CC59F|nr:AAA family ATPase [Sinomonas humi]